MYGRPSSHSAGQPRDQRTIKIELRLVARWRISPRRPSVDSADRSYLEAERDPSPMTVTPGTRIAVPPGIAMFPGEAQFFVPCSFADRCYRIERWPDTPRGGHFAAQGEPQLFAEDIRAFFRDLGPS
jgi:hypothetical protein